MISKVSSEDISVMETKIDLVVSRNTKHTAIDTKHTAIDTKHTAINFVKIIIFPVKILC